MRFTALLGMTLVALCATQAQALTWSITTGAYSSLSGALHETFDAKAIDPADTLDVARTGGNLFSSNVAGVTARPPGSIGQFLSVGITGGQSGPITIDLAAGPASYYGFLWGSPDAYNLVELYDGTDLLVSLSGAAAFAGRSRTATGYQGAYEGGQYFNAFAGAGQQITRVVLRSTSNAFETDNHALTRAATVPEPGAASLAMLALGLGALATRRRNLPPS